MTEQGQTTLVIIGARKQELPEQIKNNPENLFWSPDRLHAVKQIPSGIERAVTTEQMPLAAKNALQSLPRDEETAVREVKDLGELVEYLGSQKDLASATPPVILVVPDRSVVPRELERILNNNAEKIMVQTMTEAASLRAYPAATTAVILFRINDTEVRPRLKAWAHQKQINFQTVRNMGALLDLLDELA